MEIAKYQEQGTYKGLVDEVIDELYTTYADP